MSLPYDAVLFDYGGVLTESPFVALDALLADLGGGIAVDELRELVFGVYHEDTDHGWHRMERGELGFGDYFAELTSTMEARGLSVELATFARSLGTLASHDHMLELVAEVRAAGVATAMVTNNVAEGRGAWQHLVEAELFDVVVDSSAVGVRKPDPRIYRLTLERLGGVEPSRALMLDDAPGNVAGAERAGLDAILVTDDGRSAAAELRRMLGLGAGA